MTLRNKKDIIPVVVVFVIFFFQICMVLFINSFWVGALCYPFLLFALGSVAAINHNHSHNKTFHSGLFNNIYEFILGMQVAAPKNIWKLHHVVGHHRHYMNQDYTSLALDESNWLGRDHKPFTVLRYVLYNTALSFPRTFRNGFKYPRIFLGFLLHSFFQLFIFFLGVFFFEYNYLIFIVIPAVITYVGVFYNTYSHHVGLLTDNIYESCYNIVNRFYNMRTFNLGYHLAHHIRPGLHWSELPKYHEQIAHFIPKDLIISHPSYFGALCASISETRKCIKLLSGGMEKKVGKYYRKCTGY